MSPVDLPIIDDVGVELISSCQFQSLVVPICVAGICSSGSPVLFIEHFAVLDSPIHVINYYVVHVPFAGQMSYPILSSASPALSNVVRSMNEVVSPNVAHVLVTVSDSIFCINLSDSSIVGYGAELSVDCGEETLANVGDEGSVMPLVDVPVSIISNANINRVRSPYHEIFTFPNSSVGRKALRGLQNQIFIYHLSDRPGRSPNRPGTIRPKISSWTVPRTIFRPIFSTVPIGLDDLKSSWTILRGKSKSERNSKGTRSHSYGYGVFDVNHVVVDIIIVFDAQPSVISEVGVFVEGVIEAGGVNVVGVSPGTLTAPAVNNVVKECRTVVAGLEQLKVPLPVLGEENSAGVGLLASGSPVVNVNCNSDCGRVETLNGLSVGSENFIDVSVNLVDTNTLVNQLGVNSGFDIRNHVDWLNGSSKFESESEFSDCGASPEF
ncbi:hypothetical protein MA16_Dca004732 [Dendrobium catenatum]|uniref:Uncharacterized protein n=1 Tax=Dendrobium catenatum TaxID=906689 RepID=A0A2I0VNY2_9ASPA|nr:hypothetical protein MA16_Dca004732 [Dendrobium catenatum]